MALFKNRSDAGRKLAVALEQYQGEKNLVVLALPRGGVPVAYEVATALRAPLDVMVVRKLGVPGHAELAMGAIASGNIRIINEQIVSHLGIAQPAIDTVAEREGVELARREQ